MICIFYSIMLSMAEAYKDVSAYLKMDDGVILSSIRTHPHLSESRHLLERIEKRDLYALFGKIVRQNRAYVKDVGSVADIYNKEFSNKLPKMASVN